MPFDLQVYLDGYHGDCSATFEVGKVDESGKDLIEAARYCRDAGISVCGPGVRFRNIGKAIR